jgi:hypothetical protein
MHGSTKRRPRFSCSFYCASHASKSFWRWEVANLSTKIICDVGFLYGTKDDAVDLALKAIARLTSLAQPKTQRHQAYMDHLSAVRSRSPLNRPST